MCEVRVGDCCCFITCRDLSSVLFTLAGTWRRVNSAPNKTLETSSTNSCIKSAYFLTCKLGNQLDSINRMGMISVLEKWGSNVLNYRHPSLFRERTTVWHGMITTILCLAVDRTKTENNETVDPPPLFLNRAEKHSLHNLPFQTTQNLRIQRSQREPFK